ncbi:hypothetical protein LROSL1_0089 [Furfurilactobacillus rossiae]|uniref:hypothetical protein n=1 Tax=Furfurilactobacillus rossiae TaxID=231049 RepID=UPI0015BC1C57|nr:hypothetical protein [Furfurilactobacillus rossiae]MCF6165077.1 hypothetical protein [Furfurilactobacillus rossiae]QLE62909.1 hypothetical protein LROSL1_0089 [Furfurilactobacillus rossiae]
MKNAIKIAMYAGISWIVLSAAIYLIYGNQPDQLSNIGELALIIGVISGVAWLSMDAPKDKKVINKK